MELTLISALKSDAPLLISLYNAAFYDDYIRYGECPAYGRSLERMEDSIARFPKYILSLDGLPVGVVSYEDRHGGEYYVGCLCVVPEQQRRGIGSQALELLKARLPDWRHIHLVTPASKHENIEFYTKKCGFAPGSAFMDGGVEVVSLHLRRQTL